MGALPPGVSGAANLYPLLPVQFEKYVENQTPTTYVLIDGNRFTPRSWTIEENAHGATDTASITLPISNGPDWTQAIYRGSDAGNSEQPVYVKIYAGMVQPILRFWGIVDIYSGRLTATPDGDAITFSCRSFAAPLISTKITTPFSGPTSTTTQFIQQQAARFGLNTQILLAGAPLTMQQVLGNEFSTGVHNVEIWRLMLQCAVQDDVDIWVDGNTLWYAAPSLISRVTADMKWGRDIETLDFSHATQFSKNIRVEVRSYTKRIKQSSYVRYETGANGKGVITSEGSRTVTSTPVFGTTQSITNTISNTGTQTVTSSNTTGGSSSGSAGVPAAESGKELYTFYVKNKTQQQCFDLAKKFWRQISQHEFSITLNFPVTAKKLPVIGKTSLIRLHGTPFAYLNSTYWPRRITETFDPESGWNWSIVAINHEGPNGEV
jgi:hypothetical protein